MAEQVIPVGYAKVNIEFIGDAVNNPAQITFGVHNTAPQDVDTIADNVHDAFTSNIFPDISDDLTWNRTLVKLGPNSTGTFGEFFESNTGAASGISVPPQVALLVQKRTATGGRRGRGRFYMPGIPRAATNEHGELLDANRVTMQADWDGFLADMATAALALVVLHDDSTTPTPITSLQVSGTLATQRRRQRP